MSEKILKSSLEKIIENEPHSLKSYVAKEAIEQESIQSFFQDLSQYGCVSGMVSSLMKSMNSDVVLKSRLVNR